MALINCPECGNEVSDTAKKCIHCGYQLKQSRFNKKKAVLISISAIVFVVLFVSIILLRGNSNNSGYFDNNEWGTSYAEIKDKYGDNISEMSFSGDGLGCEITDFNGITGVNCWVEFGFDKDDKLNQVLMIFVNESTMSDDELYSTLYDMTSESYGESEEANYGYSWKTEESIISLKRYPNSSGILIIFEENSSN